MATMPWFLSNNVFAGEHGETDNRVPLYNAHKGITFVQDKKIRLDSCFIQSKIYNDSTRMDVVYYVTGVSSLNPVRLQLPDFGWFKEYSKNQLKLRKETLWDVFINDRKISNNDINFTFEYNQFSIEAERRDLLTELSWIKYNEGVDSVNLLFGGISKTDGDNWRKYVLYPSEEKQQAAEDAIKDLEIQRRYYLEANDTKSDFNYSNTFFCWAQFEVGKSYKIHISYLTSPCYDLANNYDKWFQYSFEEMKNFLCDDCDIRIDISVPNSNFISIEHLYPSDCLVDCEKGYVRYRIRGNKINDINDITFQYQIVSDKISEGRSPYPRVVNFNR